MTRSVLMLLLLAGCATVSPVPLTIPENKWVETQPLPPDPATEKVAEVDGDWVEQSNEVDCLDANGKITASAP